MNAAVAFLYDTLAATVRSLDPNGFQVLVAHKERLVHKELYLGRHANAFLMLRNRGRY